MNNRKFSFIPMALFAVCFIIGMQDISGQSQQSFEEAYKTIKMAHKTMSEGDLTKMSPGADMIVTKKLMDHTLTKLNNNIKSNSGTIASAVESAYDDKMTEAAGNTEMAEWIQKAKTYIEGLLEKQN